MDYADKLRRGDRIVTTRSGLHAVITKILRRANAGWYEIEGPDGRSSTAHVANIERYDAERHGEWKGSR